MMKRKGFTLIELLVVMTIIAVLAGLALVSYQGARKTARDGKRKADLEQIRSALEMCYADTNEYPASINASISCDTPPKIYLDPTPTDPISGRQYAYTRGADKVSYTLCAALEASGETVSGCGDCGAICNYKVTSP